MISPERLAAYKKQALKSVAARSNNPNAPGLSCVLVSPHDLLDLILQFEESVMEQKDDPAEQPTVP